MPNHEAIPKAPCTPCNFCGAFPGMPCTYLVITERLKGMKRPPHKGRLDRAGRYQALNYEIQRRHAPTQAQMVEQYEAALRAFGFMGKIEVRPLLDEEVELVLRNLSGKEGK